MYMFFFFQAEDGIRDADVTGVQTCALPILHGGIQATLMDEAAAWVVFVCLKTAGLTTELTTRYLKPVYIENGQITIKRSEEHTSELQSRPHLVCRLLLEKKKTKINTRYNI